MKMPQPYVPSKHRPKSTTVFRDADHLWEMFQAYKEFCKDNPVPIGNKGRIVTRPMTIAGLAAHVGCGRATVHRAADREDLKDTWDCIQNEIEDSLTVGGLTRALDGNLVARVAGLADRQKVEQTNTPIEQQYDFSKLDSAELETLQTLLEKAAITS